MSLLLGLGSRVCGALTLLAGALRGSLGITAGASLVGQKEVVSVGSCVLRTAHNMGGLRLEARRLEILLAVRTVVPGHVEGTVASTEVEVVDVVAGVLVIGDC